ncbi:hypothetical protein [Halobellus sp. EA9]|uniref:hypothetical protein n=1 Tax=Halobellus sp. EA9 TaxID=3421647 RepID=UPI003EC12B2C
MSHHEIPDGTYRATVDTCTEDLVTLISPTCDPSVLITPEDTLSCTEIEPGDSRTITIADGTISDLEDGTE